MKYLLLLSSLFLHSSLFSQVIISEKSFDSEYRYTTPTPKKAIKINDSTIFFALFSSYDSLTMKLYLCDKELNPKWVVKDSAYYSDSFILFKGNNQFQFIGFNFNLPDWSSFYYRRLTIDSNGNLLTKFSTPKIGKTYGLSCPFVLKTDSGCVILENRKTYSDMVFYSDSDSLLSKKTIDTVPNHIVRVNNEPIICGNNIISIGATKYDSIGVNYRHLYFMKFDLQGNKQKIKIYAGFNYYFDSYSYASYSYYDATSKATVINDSLIAYVCSEYDSTSKNLKARLVFFNNDGDSLRQSIFGEDTGMLVIYNMNPTSDGNLLVYGYYLPTSQISDTAKQFYAAKLDLKGELIWKKIWGENNSYDALYTCVEMDSGKYTVIGVSQGLLYKCVLADSKTAVSDPVLSESELKISPNPAGNTLKIENASDYDKIEIFDIRGELVATFSSAQELDISRLSSGAYNIKAYAGNKTQTGRFVKN